MSNDILFTEKQRFNQWWLLLLLLGINGTILYGAFKQVVYGVQFGNKAASNAALIFFAVLTLLISLFLLITRLETMIKRDGIYVRFYPFQKNFKKYPWETITRSYTRKYSAIGEYGGWGVRIGPLKKGNAYNISGNKGLQLEFTNRKKLLIGTNKVEEMNSVLNELAVRQC